MTAPLPIQPALAIQPDEGAYLPGVCNIGPWEARRRMAFGIAGLAVAAGVLTALVAADAPAAARVAVVVPAWGGAFSVLQARRRFCGAYALRGLSNFGDSDDTIRQVEDDAAHRADLAATARMARDSLAIAVALTTAAVLLPG
jgi:hypothetical protein